MRKPGFLFAALLGLGVSFSALPQGTARADDDADHVAKLIKQLGSNRFAERDKAKRALEAIGAPALNALKTAAGSADLETSRRAGELVKKMEEKVAIDSLLAPKRVRLQLKDTPVLDAVAQLAKQSGYSIAVQGDRTKLAERKVTLDTGDSTFWQAFDQLCQKAGLAEMNPTSPYGGPGGNPYDPRPILLPPNGRLPIRIQPLPAPGVLPVIPPGKALPPPAIQFQQKGVQIQIDQQGGGVAVQRIAVQPVAPAQAPRAQQAQAGQAQAQPAIRDLPAQVQPAPGQIQIQPVPPGRPIQIQPFPPPGGGPMPIRQPVYNPNQINLTAGKPQTLPTSYAGAIRVRALPSVQQQPGMPPQTRRAGEALITLEIAAEPRLGNYFNVTGTAQINKATDDRGQKLSEPMDPAPGVNNNATPFGARTAIAYRPYYGPTSQFIRYTTVRLKLGEKQAKTLTELTGHVPVQMLAPAQALLSVDNVLKSAGKTVKGVSGGSLEIIAIEKQGNGTYKVQFRLQTPPNHISVNNFPGGPIGMMPPNGQMQIQVQIGGGVARPGFVGNINGNGLPTLVDAKGQSFQLVQPPARMWRANFGGPAMQEVTMVFRAQNGQGDPARFVLNGQRPITVQVPFTLNNVPLP